MYQAFLICKLFMIKLLCFILGFTGQVHAQMLEEIFVNLRKHYRGVNFTALEFGQLIQSQGGCRIGCGTDGQCQQQFVGVESGVFAAQMIDFQVLYRFNDYG